MPYVIDAVTAQTINVNSTLTVNGQPILGTSFYDNGDSSINTDINWSNGSTQEINIDNNPTLTFSNGVIGDNTSLLLKQQLPGQRTITWPGDVIWNGGVSPTLQNLIAAGTIDSTFNIGAGFDSIVFKIVTQSDDKILVCGVFSSYSGVSRNQLIRLNSNATIDNTFNTNTFNNEVREITIQTDGKILVGGEFTSYSGIGRNRIIRFNSDGSVDNTFTIGSGFNNYVKTIAIQTDGKILVGGDFTSYSGNNRNRIIRLNSNGSVDNTFNIGTGFNSDTSVIVIQSDGKILVGGSFTSYNGNGRNSIIRLNSDGSVDNTFNIGTGMNSVSSMAIQSDGKIIVGGSFSDYNGTSVNNVVRLNSDGSIDNSFSSGTGFNVQPNSISIQSDGKILFGGFFTSYNNNVANRFIRLNSNGVIDNTLILGTGFNSTVYTTNIQQDEKILVGGNFTTYNGNTRNRIIRLIGTPLTTSYNITNFIYNGTNYVGYF